MYRDRIMAAHLKNRTLPTTLITQHANLRKVHLCGASVDGLETSCNLSKVATISAPKPVDIFLSEIGRGARGVEWEEEERGGEKEREMLRAQLTCEPPTALRL